MENNSNLDLSNSNLLDSRFSNIDGEFYNANGRRKAKRKAKKIKRKANFKKKVTSLKSKLGKSGKNFRNKFRKVVRKKVLSNISRNIHGTAVKLYPAVAQQSELTQRKFRPAYVAKSKKVYSELLKKWIGLGGNEAELKAAIVSGQTKKRFLKNPYKSFNGENDSYSFYSYFSSVEGESDESFIDEESGVEEVFPEEEKQKGIRGFFAWLKGIFSKNGANENPYEVGTADSKYFNEDYNEDKGNEPSESESSNDVMKEVVDTSTDDDAGGETDEAAAEDEDDSDDGKIMGLPKKTFWIGTSVVAALAIGTFVYFKFIRK